uniref:Peptidase_M13 domain-containing protein n=1 Tax=Caenorhabditis japonica TaxID=281687 RepID=A0A8R1HW39_CAEJA
MWAPLLFFLISSTIHAVNIPTELIKEHIKQNANFSVDPCDDFYAHVCSRRSQGMFLLKLTQLKDQIADDYMATDPNMKQFDESRDQLVQVVYNSAVNRILNNLDNKARTLFEKMRKVIAKAIMKTPWTNNNGAVELYLSALNNITFSTWRDAMVVSDNAVQQFREISESCSLLLSNHFRKNVVNAVCDVVGTGAFISTFKNPMPNIRVDPESGIFRDRLQQSNFEDKHVYISNDFLLLANTNIASDLYGSIGFSLAHEIMHTFVFDDIDRRKKAGLLPFWTNSSDCVAKQTLKTCKTFRNTTCDANMTFEEDAADITAYRIVYDFFRSQFARKTVVNGYDDLTPNQMFFYGAAVVFCSSTAMNPLPAGIERSSDPHSDMYLRVNTLMSQMDQFADAFKCKPTDKMVMNKATHCELYGRGASMTRKHHNPGV